MGEDVDYIYKNYRITFNDGNETFRLPAIQTNVI